MKIRRIPDIDLARVAVQPRENKRIALEQLNDGWPPHSLNPMRKQIGDIFNLRTKLFGTEVPTSWAVVEKEIVKRCKSTDECSYNIAIAKCLYGWCSEEKVVSYEKSTPEWSVGLGRSLSYWSQFYSVLSNEASFIFVDPRVTFPLTAEARRFVFSVMHERLRVGDPDFASAKLRILQFKKGATAWERTIAPYSSEGVQLFTRDELNDMISETYAVWTEVLTHRQMAARKTGTSDNPMGF